ncbi:MAG: cation diffusion facilitator family transporter, partial [Candidatus Ranarchaeia archaeon]
MRDEKYRQIMKILFLIMIANLVVAIAKLFVGFLSNALSMIADGIHSGIDVVNNVVGLIIMREAAKPADDEHPFGHGKYEFIGAVFISFLLLTAGYEVGSAVLERVLFGMGDQNITSLNYIIMISTIAINIVVTTVESRAADRLGSPILKSDATHTRVDVFISIAVLVGIYLINLGLYIVDVIIASFVVVLIAREAFVILRDNTRFLVDAVAIDARKIEKIILSIPGIAGIHRIRSRGMKGDIWISFHITVNPGLSLEKA